MIDIEEQAAFIRENRRAAFWRGVVIGAAVMLLLTTCVGCATITRERAQGFAIGVIGGSIVATAIAHGHGSKQQAIANPVGPPQGPICYRQPDGSCR